VDSVAFVGFRFPLAMFEDFFSRLSGLRLRIDEAWTILALDTVKREIAALEVESSAPDFWSDPERARRESQKMADLKKEQDRWNALRMVVMDMQEINASGRLGETVYGPGILPFILRRLRRE
jgi:hypothetical protein